MDRHLGHPKGPDHPNHRGTTNRPTPNNKHGTRTNKIAITSSTITRATTTMADTEGTTIITTTTTTRGTAETTTTGTTTVEEPIRPTASNRKFPGQSVRTDREP